MLEAREAPGLCPGETLHPGIEPILTQLGALQAVLRQQPVRHTGVWIERDGDARFVAYGADEDGPWRGFQVDRAQFHGALRAVARDAGADVLRGARAIRAIRAGGAVVGVDTACGRRVSARWTIDATGSRAWLADQLGLRADVCSPRLRARFGWRDLRRQVTEPRFVVRADGWDWTAPISRGREAWVELRVGAGGGADVTWRVYPRCAGPGYVLVGDAAAVLDPSSSHGVLRALMSGIFASHLIAATTISAADVAEVYRAWLREQFDHDAARLSDLYHDAVSGMFIVRSGHTFPRPGRSP